MENNTTENKIDQKTLTLGYFMAAIIPIIGIVFSIYTFVKGEAFHGMLILAVAITALFFWSGVLQ